MPGRHDYLQLRPLRHESLRPEWAREFSSATARRVLSTRAPLGMLGGDDSVLALATPSDREIVEKADIRNGVIWPWNVYYRIWWHVTVLAASVTVFLAPYQIAFDEGPPGSAADDAGDALETALTWLFAVDIVVTFNLARCRDGKIIFERGQIAGEYLRGAFALDVLGTFPFRRLALSLAGDGLEAADGTAYLALSLLRLFRFARLHRIKRMMDEFRYDARVSLLSFALCRNFVVVAIACHFQACCMYFLARLCEFDGDTWLGPLLHDSESQFGRYVTSLYWSITTFCTVGYGDFFPVNATEKIAGSAFMLLNIAISAWIIGSITLLMLRGDEKTREYRESLEVLQQYGIMHGLDKLLLNKLKDHLRLEFNNRETADEQVLKNFPSAVRRKILRRLYKEHLVKTKLMQGVRPQFVDAFLTSCNVEIFSPGEEIVERGSIQSDLFLLVGGIAEVYAAQKTGGYSSGDLEANDSPVCHHCPKLEVGDFIGEIGFFTETPQIDSVISLTMVKTLTMPRSVYRLLAQEHPGSVGKILRNLLADVESRSVQAQLPKSISVLRVGSKYDTIEEGYQSFDRAGANAEFNAAVHKKQESLSAVKDLVAMHLRKTHDDETTRLLFAASRGDMRTISIMCDQGFDPNSTDYDQRTALMVASYKGNADAVKLLLQYNACPNKTDIHGSSALMEATKCGHEDVMDILFKSNARLCMPESQAASVICQAVFDGDIPLMKRLLMAGIDINAADYDKRTAAHIAAAEGNVAAIRILAKRGADLTLPDRWGNTVEDEARRSNARKVLIFLGGDKE